MTTAPNEGEASPLASDFQLATIEQWRQMIDKALKGADFDRRLVARTADNLRIEPLFTARPGQLAGFAGTNRPIAGQGWDIRQLHAASDPEASNAAILDDLAGGATSIELQIAAPGQMGLPAHAIARALDGVLLDVCPVALRAGDNTAEAAASLMAVWHARGLAAAQRLGAFNDDPLGALAATGALRQQLPQALAESADLVRQSLPWPGVTALRANGCIWHAAGASEAQELAAVLATVVAYLRAAEVAGLAPSAALPKICIHLAVDADQMLGLAKLRAARLLVARIAEACGAASVAGQVVFTAETASAMMTCRDPWVNMLRTTMACATAAWGGADAITVLPYSWALGQPDAFARRMARNTSLVLMEESGLGRVADPAAGSFAIETLTDGLARAAWALFQDMEATGGLAPALTSGRWRAALAQTAAAKRSAIVTGKVPLTGTSTFPRLGEDGVSAPPWPVPAVETGAMATRIAALVAFRPSAPFEQLRDAADAFTAQHGQPPRVFLACLGPLAAHAARATWIANFLASGGITVTQSAALMQSSEAGAAFSASGATVACLCGSDEIYGEIGEAVASLLKTAGAQRVYLAGRPRDVDDLKAAGVDAVIYAGCDMIETLAAVQAALGIVASGA